MRALAGNLALLAAGALVAVSAAELGSRFAYPLASGVEHVGLDGSRVKRWLEPGRVYRQVSAEYDALTTITDAGYRAPDAGDDPDVIFLGDSFTFGWGLGDQQTFAGIYCRARGLACANLGAPGTGTVEQADRLEAYLAGRGWRPRVVKHFLFAMTASFSAGNDLSDNVAHGRRRAREALGTAPAQAPRPEGGLLERILNQRRTLLAHSNLLRLAKFYWGPALRSLLVPELDRRRLDEALRITGSALARIERLGRVRGFDYEVYLLHPVQDILRGSHANTRREIARVSPVPVRPTGPLFAANPTAYYYPFDGHINPAGSGRVAELLLTEDAVSERSGS